MVGGVDAGPRVLVLEPGPSHGVVLFEHPERNAGGLEMHGGTKTGHAAADDHHVEAVRHVDGLGFDRSLTELGRREPPVLGWDALAHGTAEHVDEKFG